MIAGRLVSLLRGRERVVKYLSLELPLLNSFSFFLSLSVFFFFFFFFFFSFLFSPASIEQTSRMAGGETGNKNTDDAVFNVDLTSI